MNHLNLSKELNVSGMVKSLLALLFILLFMYLHFYLRILDYLPWGIHFWRQMDSASMAFLYYQDGLSLLEPQVHNLLGGQGKAVGEFPLLYYLIGKLYSIFGYDIIIYRLVWGGITLFGIFSIYKIAEGLLKNSLLGFFIALFTYTSPIYLIYGISFIPDSAALSIGFISLYFFYLYHLRVKKIHFFIGLAFVLLAALLKITVTIPFIAILLTYAWYSFKESSVKEVIKKYKSELIPILVCFILIFVWYRYAMWYNEVNDTRYFFLRTNPIWDIRWDGIVAIFIKIKGWSREYFSFFSLLILGLSTFVLFALPSSNKMIKKWTFFVKIFFLGCLAYFSLFYSQFEAHDYYILCLLSIVPAILILAYKRILISDITDNLKRLSKYFLPLIVFISAAHSVERCRERLLYPEIFWNPDAHHASKLFDEHSIDEDAVFIAPYDPSPNGSLYAINRKGYSGYNLSLNTTEYFIEQGAEYMLITSDVDNVKPYVSIYTDSLIMEYNQVRVYRTKLPNTN